LPLGLIEQGSAVLGVSLRESNTREKHNTVPPGESGKDLVNLLVERHAASS
jgi:hypothetical protein